MHDIYEKVESVSAIINRWPLHMFSMNISSDLDLAVTDMTTHMMVAVESTGINGSYELNSCISSANKIIGIVKKLKSAGITLEGMDEIMTHLPAVIVRLSDRARERERIEAEALNSTQPLEEEVNNG